MDRVEICQILAKIETGVPEGIFVAYTGRKNDKWGDDTSLYGAYTKTAVENDGFSCINVPCNSEVYLKVEHPSFTFEPVDQNLAEVSRQPYRE